MEHTCNLLRVLLLKKISVAWEGLVFELWVAMIIIRNYTILDRLLIIFYDKKEIINLQIVAMIFYIMIDFVLFVFFKWEWFCIRRSLSLSDACSCDSLIFLYSVVWEGVGSICCLGCFGFARNRPMFFLWAAFAAIFCWDLAAISLDSFDSNILVSFGSNSLWAALVATFLVRFGNHSSGRLWQQYSGEIWQRFSLGSFSQQYSGETRQLFLSDQLW